MIHAHHPPSTAAHPAAAPCDTLGLEDADPDMAASMSAKRRRAWSGMLAVALLLGVALIGSAAASYRSVAAMAETVARGEGESYLLALRLRAPPSAGGPPQAAFEQLLAENQARGLRFIGMVDREGRLVHGAGGLYAPGDMVERPPEDAILGRAGARVRLWTPPPPPGMQPPGPPPPRVGGVPEGPPAGPPDGPPGAGGPRPGAPPPRHRVFLEFDPLLADALEASAARTLAVSLVAAIALMAAAAFLYRAALRAAAAEEQHARQRHLASLGEMSAVLAHEIRNPLAALKGHAQLLSEQLPEDGRERKRADRVVREALRLEELTGQLLDFARSGAVERAEVSPAELLDDAARAVDPARVAIDARGAPAAWPLDPVRLRQVLVNLLTNAVQASPPDAPIDAEISEAEGRLLIAVRDRGAGIPPGQEERIFEAFHTTRVHGTGLGLSVARRIVEQHGGTLRAENFPEGGAIFRISIPRA